MLTQEMGRPEAKLVVPSMGCAVVMEEGVCVWGGGVSARAQSAREKKGRRTYINHPHGLPLRKHRCNRRRAGFRAGSHVLLAKKGVRVAKGLANNGEDVVLAEAVRFCDQVLEVRFGGEDRAPAGKLLDPRARHARSPDGHGEYFVEIHQLAEKLLDGLHNALSSPIVNLKSDR